MTWGPSARRYCVERHRASLGCTQPPHFGQSPIGASPPCRLVILPTLVSHTAGSEPIGPGGIGIKDRVAPAMVHLSSACHGVDDRAVIGPQLRSGSCSRTGSAWRRTSRRSQVNDGRPRRRIATMHERAQPRKFHQDVRSRPAAVRRRATLPIRVRWHPPACRRSNTKVRSPNAPARRAASIWLVNTRSLNSKLRIGFTAAGCGASSPVHERFSCRASGTGLSCQWSCWRRAGRDGDVGHRASTRARPTAVGVTHEGVRKPCRSATRWTHSASASSRPAASWSGHRRFRRRRA